MRAVVHGVRELKLGLDADFHALRFALALEGALALEAARAVAGIFLVEIDLGGEGQAGLGFVGTQMAAARAIFFQAARDFTAPFGFWFVFYAGGGGAGVGVCGDADSYRLSSAAIFDKWEITEGALLDVLEREGATLRAYSYHWSVLRCGSSSGGTMECYHDGEGEGTVECRERVA
ncbi:MAG: hypothetical protein ACRD5M_08985 [Candidatus Acidiferrales bacterium]